MLNLHTVTHKIVLYVESAKNEMKELNSYHKYPCHLTL